MKPWADKVAYAAYMCFAVGVWFVITGLLGSLPPPLSWVYDATIRVTIGAAALAIGGILLFVVNHAGK
jgi:hypothetical protein